jgi:tRNA/rRNA methyltransferase
MIDQFEGMLEGAGYFFPPDKVPTTKRMIRTLLTKPAWSAPEVRTVRGMLSALARPRDR